MAPNWFFSSVIVGYCFVLYVTNGQMDQEEQKATLNLTNELDHNWKLEHVRFQYLCESIGEKTEAIEETLVCPLELEVSQGLCHQGCPCPF